ncbi:MAG TPA: TlpA disulfide reductase family protein [Bryobacteraceae bacterium]|nr:TlpA disulfide reductase family protein [Bryobacteraceae bacterium]
MKWRLAVALLLTAAMLAAQPSPPAPRSNAEQRDLERALSAAGANPLEYLRAIESHLAKYPQTARRAELEGAAARAAIQAGDNHAIVEYGERVLIRRPDDLVILQAVARALLAGTDRDGWERALRYARRIQDILVQQRNEASPHGRPPSLELQDHIDREMAAALAAEARATGNLDKPTDALFLARRAFETFPTPDTAREAARWSEALHQPLDAARALADAITLQDPRATLDDRARDRARMDELYRQAKGSTAGEGDLLLEAFDRNVALLHARELRTRASDPNALISDPMNFTITALDGSKFKMSALEGKVVVLDFWATWCVPCREQHPLLEEVRRQFAGNPEVVFLAIDTDDNRDLVKPFLDQSRWDDRIYFDDGLSRNLAVMSLPTIAIFNRSGKLFSRITGVSAASQFVSTLTERIRDALK